MTADVEKIRRAAETVRRWAIKAAPGLGFKPSLAGMCAIASARLFKLLTKQGVEGVKICVNDYHCFLMLDNMIIDVTAGQFGQGDDNNGIVIGEMPKSPARYWKPVVQLTSVPDLIQHQKTEGWWEDQVARP